MKPYLIALDLDGTLLMSDKKIGDRTKKVIRKVREAGHIVMFATGRPYRASKNYYFELGLDTPVVNFNGAYVHHPLDSDWGVFHHPIPLATINKILRTCAEFKINNIIIEVMNQVYIKNPDPVLVENFSLKEIDVVYGPIQEKLKTDPTSILFQTEKENVEKIIQALETEHADAIEQRSWGHPSNIIEVVSKGTNKALGIHRVAERLDIPKDRIIAFGDEENDLEMISYAGYGIAMGNAIPSLKSIAKEVTASNDEEGIADFLESFFLQSPVNNKR